MAVRKQYFRRQSVIFTMADIVHSAHLNQQCVKAAVTLIERNAPATAIELVQALQTHCVKHDEVDEMLIKLLMQQLALAEVSTSVKSRYVKAMGTFVQMIWPGEDDIGRMTTFCQLAAALRRSATIHNLRLLEKAAACFGTSYDQLMHAQDNTLTFVEKATGTDTTYWADQAFEQSVAYAQMCADEPQAKRQRTE